jgi:hypothetical protein
MNVPASSVAAISVAVIDGPYDAAALQGILAQAPVKLGIGGCGANPSSACNHGTFVMGLLGARRDVILPGICPDCKLLHIPLFLDEDEPSASIADLARAITVAVAAGANLINLSLAILGDDAQYNRELAAALDRAEACGAVVVVAAGNQGRLAIGQLLSHRVTIPVVALDAARRLAPGCNFGPSISRGVAALGQEVPGYAPGGVTTVMSGTSVATAVVTGTLALMWSERPEASGFEIRAAVARLRPRNGPIPPILDRDVFLAELDRIEAAKIAHVSGVERRDIKCAWLQGVTTMRIGNDPPVILNRAAGPMATSAGMVTPAQGSNGCACGAPGGHCTCADGVARSNFVYVLGSVDIRFPDPSISWELQEVGRTLKIPEPKAASLKDPYKDPLREWYHQVLKMDEARYVARQVCWVLTVEKQPAYYLALSDLDDLKKLVDGLSHPEDDLDLFIGSSSLIPVDLSQGFVAPVLQVEQLTTFRQDDLLKLFPTLAKRQSKQSESGSDVADISADDLKKFYNKIVQSADNFGETDAWRALNYLAVRYQPLYQTCVEMAREGYILDGVRVATSRLAREKRIVDPVFSFQNNAGAVRKHFVRVDVSHLFPMVVVKQMDEYIDR